MLKIDKTWVLNQTNVRKKEIVIVSHVAAFYENTAQTPLQIVEDPIFIERGVKVYIKRDDLIHPNISGNKWRKLKYNLLEAERTGSQKLLTFGGAFSNHIAAVAAAGQALNFETIGIIRGEELTPDSNTTLQFAKTVGMQLIFVSRTDYRNKEELENRHGKGAFIIPEGGSNALAIEGVKEVMQEIAAQLPQEIDYVCTALGTGGTAAGITSVFDGRVVVFPSLKIKNEEAEQMILQLTNVCKGTLDIKTDYHFGGYGKSNERLLEFIKNFEQINLIPLEQVYTGKMMFGIYDLLLKGYFKKGDVVVVIHTGGLQGRNSFLDEIKRK